MKTREQIFLHTKNVHKFENSSSFWKKGSWICKTFMNLEKKIVNFKNFMNLKKV